MGIIAGVEFVLLAGAALLYYKKNIIARSEKRDLMRFIVNLAVKMIKSYFVIVDEEGKIITCSDSLVQIINADSREKLQGMQIRDLITRFANEELVWKIQEEIEENNHIDKVYEFKHEQGKSRWMDVKSQKIMLDDTYGSGTIVFCSDVSAQMEGKEELLSLVHLKEQILMAVSHELRTPLNAIAGSVDMLSLSKSMGENEKRHVKNIKEAYRTLVRRVDELTEYSSIKKEELVVENREFVLQEIFDAIRNTVYIRAYEKGIDFCIQISPDIPAKLYGDAEKISSVLLHLLLKAAERTEEGVIGLSIKPVKRKDKLFLNYEILDTAATLSKEEIANILEYSDLGEEPFAVGITISREYIKAMGGELKIEAAPKKGNCFWFELETKAMSDQPAVCVKNPDEKSVIICSDSERKLRHSQEMMSALGVDKCETYTGREQLENMVWSHIIIDGSFKEASEILKMELSYPCKKILVLEASRKVIDGLPKADIILYEPLHVFMLEGVLNQEENKKQKQAEDKLLFKTKNVRALVVDDNPVNIMVCTNILKQYGIETDEADSGILAVQKYYDNDYDIIIMDYRMPGMDGIEVTKKLRGLPKKSCEPVIIILSANITDSICKEFKEAGAQETLAKPMELKELSRALRRWIPKEQIIETEEEQKEQEKQLSEETLYAVLRDVKGLNIEAGLGHVLNSTESYVRVLSICRSNVTEQITRIKAGYGVIAPVDLKLYFHSLKGIFANIGAEELAEKSKQMELVSDENDNDGLTEHMADYVKACEALVWELDSALTLYKDILSATMEAQEAYEPIEPEQYKKLVEKAKEAVRQYEFTEITSIIETLVRGSKGQQKEILEKALEKIGEFQYDAVMELLEKL